MPLPSFFHNSSLQCWAGMGIKMSSARAFCGLLLVHCLSRGKALSTLLGWAWGPGQTEQTRGEMSRWPGGQST